MRVSARQKKDLADFEAASLMKKKTDVINALMDAGKPHKFRAEATTLDGIRFPSKAEAARYAVLLLRQKAGEISDLVVQPEYPLHANGWFIGFYIADFRYVEHQASGDRVVVEDVKGVRTQLYRWKKKHAEAEHGIRIVEIKGR